MKKILKTIKNIFLLSLVILIIYCVIDKTKSEAVLFESNNKYVKHTLQKGLNIISIDLGGPNLNKNIRKNGSYGDATLIEQNGKYLLIDTGNRKLDSSGKEIDNNVLINFLKAQKVKKLSIFISHYHIDHYGKVEAILKDSYFTVEKLYLPDPKIVYSKVDNATQKKTFDNWYEDYIAKLKKAGAKEKNIILTKKNSSLDIGEAKLKVIWDYSDINLKYSSFKLDRLGGASNHYVNNTSLGTMITYKDKKVLMAGDIEEKGEKKILDKVNKKTLNIQADILKLSHHGGVSSNISAFIEKVGPKYAFMPNNATKLNNNPDMWQGDRSGDLFNFKNPYNEKAGVAYNANINSYKTFKAFVNSLASKTNLYSTLYNGCTLFNISTSGVITVDTTRHYNTLTVKYVDIDTKKEIQDSENYKFCDRSEYHLETLNYIKYPKAYVFLNSTYQPKQILTKNQTVTCNYEKKKIAVSYSNTQKTNTKVAVTLKSNTNLKSLSGWKLSQNKKELSKLYDENKTEEIKVEDESGYIINAKVVVNNIDKKAPTTTVKYSTTATTNQNVKVTVTANETIQGITGWTLSSDKKSLAKTYSVNQTETITIKDIAGNTSNTKINIKNIDKIKPTIEGVANGRNYKDSVKAIAKDENLDTVLLERNETKVVGYTNGDVISEKGIYRLTATDKAGNCTIINFAVKDTIVIKSGELNGNNQIDIGDILLILRHLAQENDKKIYQKHSGWRFNEKQKIIADINRNGKIDIGDILILRRYMAAKNNKDVVNKHPNWLNIN